MSPAAASAQGCGRLGQGRLTAMNRSSREAGILIGTPPRPQVAPRRGIKRWRLQSLRHPGVPMPWAASKSATAVRWSEKATQVEAVQSPIAALRSTPGAR